MRQITIFILLMLFGITANAQEIVKQSLKSIALISFPDTPQLKKTSLGEAYVINYNGDVYLANYSNCEKSFKDLFTSHFIDSLYNGFCNGVLKSAQGHKIYKKAQLVDGLEGVELAHTTLINNVNCIAYYRAVYLNGTIFSFCMLSKDSLKSDDKRLKTFFNSFKITLPDDKIRQSNASDLGYYTGTAIATFVFIILFVAVIVLIVYVIRRLSK